jgi:excisionase family DNA binding protein
MDPDREILTTAELAQFLRCNRSTINKLAKRGELPGFRVGSDWRFRAQEILEWLEKSSNSHPQRRSRQ